MTRTRAASKAAGTRAETAVVRYLQQQLGTDHIERRAKTGSRDRGDVSGLRHLGGRIVVEVKSVARMALAEWVQEAEVEAANDSALLGVVWHKRRGTADPGGWYVTLSGAAFVAMLTGEQAS